MKLTIILLFAIFLESSRDSRGWKHNDSSPDPTIFGRRKSKRLSKGIKKSPELIDMCSDSEEEGGEGSDQSVQVSEPCGAEVTMFSYVLSIH
jgi:hypothetical protein